MSSKLTISIAVATLAASLGAYAAVPTGASPFQVVVPNLKSGVEFTVTGLYLQPTNSDLDYATTVQTTSGSNTTTTNVSTLNPDYNLGFAIGLGYVFADSGNDVQANWTHFSHNNTTSQVFNGNSPTIISKAGIVFNDANPGDQQSASSTADFKYDAVDLDVGQYISVGTRLQTRLFAGLRYAQIKNNLTDTYNDNNIPRGGDTSNTTTETYNSKFTGIGPRMGVDVSYHVGGCFGVVGHMAATLLVGRVEANSNVVQTESPIPFTNTLGANADNQTRIVPGFDMKLGVDYSIPFRNDASRFTIEAGYQATQYVDAIDRLTMQTNGSITDASLVGVGRTTSGIGFNGPYLSLNYKM